MSHNAIAPQFGGEEAGPLVEQNKGLKLHLLPGARRLATPWQVALERSQRLAELDLPRGAIIDPACGSGVQLAAHMLALQKPGFGVEIDQFVAYSAAANIWRVGTFERSEEPEWLKPSKVIVGDGTDSDGVLSTIGDIEISILQLDPARPQNSISHDIDEMSPSLSEIFSTWGKALNQAQRGPALLLDLSPRLSSTQCAKIENLVDNYWPDIKRTWEWTSRGAGRIDRLSLWLGSASTPNIGLRFVRISPKHSQGAIVIEDQLAMSDSASISEGNLAQHTIKCGDYLTILDTALVSSGLSEKWLQVALTDSDQMYWLEFEGRRPIVVHSEPLNLTKGEETLLIQATGKIVELPASPISLENVSTYADLARKNKIKSLTIRAPLNPETHPKVQSLLHKTIGKKASGGTGFIVADPQTSQHLICQEYLL